MKPLMFNGDLNRRGRKLVKMMYRQYLREYDPFSPRSKRDQSLLGRPAAGGEGLPGGR